MTTADEKMREEFDNVWKSRSGLDENSYVGYENAFVVWKLSASQNSARIKKLEQHNEQLKNKLEMAEAIIAGNNVLLTENEQLQAQVVMLRNELKEVEVVRMNYEESCQVYFTCPSCEFNEGYASEVVRHDPKCGLNNAINATTQTAEAYKRRVKAEALMEAADILDITPRGDFPEEQLRRMASELLKEGE